MFQCTWPECRELAESCHAIEGHIRVHHLGRNAHHRSHSRSSLQSCSDIESDSDDDHEEEFYWTEVDVNVATSVDPGTSTGVINSARNTTVNNSNSAGIGCSNAVNAGVLQGAVSQPLTQPQIISNTTLTTTRYIVTETSSQEPICKHGHVITINNNTRQLGTSLPTSSSAAATTLLTLNSNAARSTPSTGHVITNTSPSVLSPSQLPRPNNSSSYQYVSRGAAGTVVSMSASGRVIPSMSQYVQVSSPPTLSHMDMARPPHEDPEYRRQRGLSHGSGALLSSSWDGPSSYLMRGSNHHMGSGGGKVRVTSSPKASPGRSGVKRGGESSKCRKFYGMELKSEWCTQCKWKKACTRFVGGGGSGGGVTSTTTTTSATYGKEHVNIGGMRVN